METQKIHGDLCHETLRDSVKQKLAFNPDGDFTEQKNAAKAKLIELLGLDDIISNKASNPEFTIEEVEECDGYTRTRFSFKSEVDSTVPCHLLIPNDNKDKYPLAITMQGHSSGFHNSIGVAKSEHDEEYIKRGDFAVQAVKEGFAALARRIKEETSKTIWCYTGYTLEALVQEHDHWKMDLLRNIDVLVDGPFVQDLRDEQLRFRGSSNQRILERDEIMSKIS